MFVTVELLDKLNACKAERNRFAKLFPQGVELTRELIVQHAQEFNWGWCAENLASPAGLAAYRRAIEPALAVYWQTIAPTLAAYKQAKEPAGAAYNLARATAFAAYLQAEESARAAYKLARATAFADAMGL